MARAVLVVDDDPTIRELLRIHLSAAGYEVRLARDGVEAGYMVLQSPPGLIVTDVNMPRMDGFEFIAAMRSDKTLPEIPVVFLTSEEEGEHCGKSIGAAGYVTKPIRADRLLAILETHLPVAEADLPRTP